MSESSKLTKEVISEIKEQIEYYLSEENLEKDYFFNDKISLDPESYLDLKFLLKCNKIKKKGWTKEDLKKGIELSTILELDPKGEKVRRKDQKLPELLLLQKKRKKDSKKESHKKEEEKEEEKEKKEPFILKLTCKEKSSASWKKIFDEFKSINPELDVEYGRFKDNEGHIGIILKDKQDLENLKWVKKFKVDEIEFNAEKCEGEDLINFWKDHGSHYEYCMKLREKHNKAKEEKSKKNKKYFTRPIKLGKKEFTNIDLVKSHTKKLLNKYKDDEKLEGEDKEFIVDLLKYHHNYKEKAKDMDYITVGENQEHKHSRCFFIVDKNKNKKDFSSKKCIENILEKLNNNF